MELLYNTTKKQPQYTHLHASAKSEERKYLCSSLRFGSGKVSATATRNAMTRASLPSTPINSQNDNYDCSKWKISVKIINYHVHFLT